MKKTAYPLIHLLAFTLAAPLFVACAHVSAGEEVDGLAAASQDTAAEQTTVADTQELEAALEASTAPEPQVMAAQKKINKDKKAHKKVLHPFADPRSAMARPTSAPIREVLAEETPKEVSQTVVRDGSTLNRYYYMRSGDTAETLSTLFYDNNDRAAELVEWNGPVSSWAPGKVIYYRSAKQADDTRLVSYYMEAGVEAEEVTMLPGDTLRTIASQRYGSQDSWREIAALNGIRNEADALAGGKLKMYPPALATTELKATEATVAVTPAPEKQVSKAKLASAGISAFVQRHPRKVGIGGAVVLILAGLLFAQRRRQRSRFDF
jgi:hypothetical protein